MANHKKTAPTATHTERPIGSNAKQQGDSLVLNWKSLGAIFGAGFFVAALIFWILSALGFTFPEFGLGPIKIHPPVPVTGPPGPNSSSVPPVRLVGIGYSIWAWNPQQVDLRTAATEGIAVDPDTALGLLDVRVSVPEALNSTYQTQVEVYANDTDFIGKTKMTPLAPGVVELGDVMPASYVYDTLKNNWRVQAEWSELTIYVNVFDQNSANALGTEKTHIKLSQANGNSWWTSPPYANFVSVTYRVNEGEEQLVDLRRAESTGINIQPGDTLRILEIWYRSWTAEDTVSIFAEAYLTSGGFNSATHLQTAEAVMMPGAHNLLEGQTFEWTVAQGKNSIVFTLSRNDGYYLSTVLDRLIIPLNAGASNHTMPSFSSLIQQ